MMPPLKLPVGFEVKAYFVGFMDVYAGREPDGLVLIGKYGPSYSDGYQAGLAELARRERVLRLAKLRGS